MSLFLPEVTSFYASLQILSGSCYCSHENMAPPYGIEKEQHPSPQGLVQSAELCVNECDCITVCMSVCINMHTCTYFNVCMCGGVILNNIAESALFSCQLLGVNTGFITERVNV